ncbi:hypothetical protein [Nocardioides mesophilus]|uniref:DUF308 domain-containing protein n=1 Tax=Nocardioides mesophilus TaxID=433659 RepID=A0A7G9RC22_9ACTN|nr:hypothetical protein [Nocardioides mesophilus]QNN53147.1 hypothetical protein H9L09_01215 [Nocardioides mesophilus]
MTHPPEDRPPEEPTGASEAEPALDDDAVWREIIANYGDRAELPEAEEPTPAPRRSVFDRSYLDAQLEASSTELNTTASWDDEGHFVPPPPPPLPEVEPRRRLAWAGLFGAPLLMLIGVIFDYRYPTWLGGMLVLGFVGGFVYLVATMSRKRRDDWSGDDGAVV